MLHWLAQGGYSIPAPSTFPKRKAALLPQVIPAVKAPAHRGERPVRSRMDSQKLPTAVLGRASRVALPGALGRDHASRVPFYGLWLHVLVDDQGLLRRVLLRPANEHDLQVAPWLLDRQRYVVVTGYKGYLSPMGG